METRKMRTAEDPSEQLLFCTIRIAAKRRDGQVSLGTGFFFCFAESDDGHVPAIVTNRHVLHLADSVELTFRRSAPDMASPLAGPGFLVTIGDVHNYVIPHPDPEIDLCLIPLARVIAQLNAEKAYPWFGMLDVDALTGQSGRPFRAIENVLMVGYPSGLWDETNNMPIVRRGITATHPALNWQGRAEFLIDAACFPGSSGSPIFLVRERLLEEPMPGGVNAVYNTRLLGILYAGPQFTAEGTIRVREVPSSSVPVSLTDIPLNLGIAIKAEKLQDFEALIKRQIEDRTFGHYARGSQRERNEEPDHVPSFLRPISL